MNVLFLTTLYPPEEIPEVTRLSKDGLQNQSNNYQLAMLEGLRGQLDADEKLSVINVLPVGGFPNCYKHAILKRRVFEKDNMIELGCINIPPFKQWGRARGAYREMLRWLGQSKDNRTMLFYTQYTPYLKAFYRVKKKYPDVQGYVIVTDLPNEWGIDTGRRGLLKRIEAFDGRQSLRLLAQTDGYVLLTQAMDEVLPMEGKRTCVVEGLVLPQAAMDDRNVPKPVDNHPVVLYTGTLNREFGISTLLEAFRTDALNSCELWLCGRGDMQPDIEREAEHNPHVRYFGFLPLEKTLALQQQATVLINPRGDSGLFTRYSFPSKTLEYMRSGKPVLCYRLSGIPREYDDYLTYISGDTPEDMAKAISSLLALSPEDRERLGQKARDFALGEKNANKQAAKVLGLLRGNM